MRGRATDAQVDRCQVYVGRTQIDARPVVSKGAPSSVPFISAIRASAGKAAIWSKGCAVRMPICPWSAHGLFLGQIVQPDLAVKGLILSARPNCGRDAHFLNAPRTDPYGPNSGIRLPPWVHDGESLFRPGVKDSRFGKPVVRQLREPLPTHAVLLAASPQRSLPEFSDRVTERVERATVRRHGV